jgi:glycosyltransferase involved in cell wall biosynthesis
MTSLGIDATRVKILANGTSVRYLPESVRLDVRARLGIAQFAPVVIFLGRMDYPPNVQAVHTIREQIAHKCPGVTFLLVGSNPPKLDLPSNVLMVGRVDSVDEYLRAADIAVVPIEQGSGTRIKILDSWAAGLPVISTRAGASGIGYQHEENIVIEDEIGAFPARISDLLADPDLLRHIGMGALTAVEPYRWDTIAPSYLKSILGLTESTAKKQLVPELI